MNIYDFNFIGSSGKHTGFMAQELYEVFPEAVKVGGEDPASQPWGINYSSLTPILTKALQELNQKVENLENDNKTLRNENEKLKSKLEKIDANENRLKMLEEQVNLLLQSQKQ
jgi:septal ring factor EnvC (AmiA/AmiB activator)